jgi:hypothetical protein
MVGLEIAIEAANYTSGLLAWAAVPLRSAKRSQKMTRKFRGIRPFNLAVSIACLSLMRGLVPSSHSAPYASGVSIQGTTVNFTLNEPADTLAFSINGGPFTFLDGTTKGLKTFNLGSASDTFSISVFKNDSVGYTIPTGIILPATANGLSQPTAGAGYRLLSNDADTLVKFNSPRGITVAANPNNPQFGTTYISNSTAATTGRLVGDGLYALKADQSDAFGYGDTPKTTGFETGTNSGNSPFRLSVGGDHNVYIADFSDAYGGVYRMSGTLTGPIQVLAGVGGPSPLPAGQNHGSTTGVYVSGSAGGLTLYTLDEDLTSSQFGGGSTTNKNSLWRYDIGASALPYAGTPTKLASELVPLATSDMDIGLNGNFYLAQNRSAGGQAGIFVLGPDGTTVLFDSLAESKTLLGDPLANDIFRNVTGIAVSFDQKYIAVMLNGSDVAVMPLDANGVPILANRLLIDTPIDTFTGRDIAFDAAGNIHYVSSGQALYRVLSPGGITAATTSWNGTSYDFVLVPEPSSALLLVAGALLLARRRR